MTRLDTRTEAQMWPGWHQVRPGLVGALAVAALAVAATFGTGGVRTHPADRAPEAEPAWQHHVAAIDAALARDDVGRAVLEWRLAYGAALGSRRWEPMAAVGDAALRIDARAGRLGARPMPFQAEARRAYLSALWTARGVKSREGIERIARAFAALGDEEMALRVGDIVQER